MPGLDNLYIKLGSLINNLIRDEFNKQGHTLTGTFERSVQSKISKTILTGYAEGYGKIINEGIKPEDVNPKMIPGLIKYFQLRGFNEAAAKKYANSTFHKWKQEGMSTDASKRFSETGERHHFIESAFENSSIDTLMSSEFNSVVDDLYRTVKSETI